MPADNTRESKMFCSLYERLNKVPVLKDLLFISLLWCISVIIINPFGNFPLNDDWSFGLTVKRLLEQGEFRPVGWASMPLISQVGWGALFCLPKGFSFEALRFSTLTLSYLGIWGTYCTARLLNCPRRIALAAALILAFNPIYFVLSNSFMTDVPFTAMSVWACFFFIRTIKCGSKVDFLLGVFFATSATLCRQLGLFIPLAYGVAILLQTRPDMRRVLHASIPPTVTIFALFSYQHWLTVSGRLPSIYYKQTNALVEKLGSPLLNSAQFVKNGWIILLYLGWFLLPLLLLVAPSLRNYMVMERRSFVVRVVAAVFFVISVVGLFLEARLMPLSKNIIDKKGIGPLILRDEIFLLTNVAPLPPWFWVVITILSIIGGAVLVAMVGMVFSLPFSKKDSCEESVTRTQKTFLLFCMIIYLLPILAAGFFDRYLIPLIPIVSLYVSSFPTVREHVPLRKWLALAVILFAFMYVFTLGTTKDYLSWNRAKWTISTELIQTKQVAPDDFDGGFEFNSSQQVDSLKRGEPEGGWFWDWVMKFDTYTYILTFGNMPGLTPVREVSFSRWIMPSTGKIVLLKKNDSFSK